MNDGLSAADVMAMANNGNGEMWNNPFIYLVWLAVLGRGGIFGGGGSNAAVQGALTRADLFEGFNNNQVENKLSGLSNGLCSGFYEANTSLLNGFNSMGNQIADNRFAAQNCCCETNRNIDSIRAENYKNTCEITNALHSEAEATRNLMTQGTIQDLRDRLEQRDRDLMAANFQLSQVAQTANLINELRPCSKPAYITCSPYATCSPCSYPSK